MQTILKEGAFSSDIRKAINQNFANVSIPFGNILYVDGDNGSNAYDGSLPSTAKLTISGAIRKAHSGDTIYVKARKMAVTDTDPVNYAENVTIFKNENSETLSKLRLIGYGDGAAQGNLPQIKAGSGSSPQLLIKAPGVYVANMGFNGGGATGGGILLTDDGGSTCSAFGTIIEGCHFKNCKGSSATDSRTGGAITWGTGGGAWQSIIRNCHFYKNVGDIVLRGTGGSVPQDILIEGCNFLGPATSVDCHIYFAGGSGSSSISIRDCYFADVLPALSSGSVVRYVDLTGCTGMIANCYFGGSYTTTGFGAAKAAAKIPTTVGLPHLYTDGGLIVREA